MSEGYFCSHCRWIGVEPARYRERGDAGCGESYWSIHECCPECGHGELQTAELCVECLEAGEHIEAVDGDHCRPHADEQAASEGEFRRDQLAEARLLLTEKPVELPPMTVPDAIRALFDDKGVKP